MVSCRLVGYRVKGTSNCSVQEAGASEREGPKMQPHWGAEGLEALPGKLQVQIHFQKLKNPESDVYGWQQQQEMNESRRVDPECFHDILSPFFQVCSVWAPSVLNGATHFQGGFSSVSLLTPSANHLWKHPHRHTQKWGLSVF